MHRQPNGRGAGRDSRIPDNDTEQRSATHLVAVIRILRDILEEETS